jgi:hypothetical protein
MRHKELLLIPIVCIVAIGIGWWVLTKDDENGSTNSLTENISQTVTDFDFLSLYLTIVGVDNAWNSAGTAEKFSAQSNINPDLLFWVERDRSKISLDNHTIIAVDDKSSNLNYSFTDSWSTVW